MGLPSKNDNLELLKLKKLLSGLDRIALCTSTIQSYSEEDIRAQMLNLIFVALF